MEYTNITDKLTSKNGITSRIKCAKLRDELRQQHMLNYRLQTKLRKGSVFTSVCQEFCLPWGIHPPWQTPPGRHQTPPWADPPPPNQTVIAATVRILLECILCLHITLHK